MATDDVAGLSLVDVLTRLADRSLGAADLLGACVRRIEGAEPSVQAFVTRTVELAQRAAVAADRCPEPKDAPALSGVPMAVKDVLPVKGVLMTSGSATLTEPVPRRSAYAWQRLADAGAGLLGKTTTHEFAYGTTSGPTTNPWDVTRTPGGSSGGSAAAVAARMVLAAIGTDTAGSLRIPAAACGIAGFRRGPERASRGGFLPLSRSLEVVGPMARRVLDVALVTRVMSGSEGERPLSRQQLLEYAAEVRPGRLRDVRIGLSPDMTWPEADEGISNGCVDAVKHLKDLDAVLVPFSGPVCADYYPGGAGALFDVIHTFEAYDAFRARLPYLRMGQQVKDRFLLGHAVVPDEYHRALQARGRWQAAWRDAMRASQVDALVFPTIHQPPPVGLESGIPIDATVPWSLLGFAVLNVPVGVMQLAGSTLPVGLSIAGLPEREDAVLRYGIALDEAIMFWNRDPQPAVRAS